MEIILAPNTMQEALMFSGRLSYCKLGITMIAAGVSPYHLAANLGYHVLYDAKFHDIPSVVGKAVESLAWRGPLAAPPIWGITVHVEGGKDMLAAAKEASGDTKIFAILRLTSLYRTAEAEMGRRLASCMNMVDGVVCAVSDVAWVKKEAPHLMTLCPGIRERGPLTDDQRRIGTVAQALEVGTDAIIVGRPLFQADDPSAALTALLEAV